MRILEIIATADPASGGPVEGLLRLDAATRSAGVVRELVTIDAPDAPHLINFPLKVHALGPAVSRPGPLAHYGYTPGLIPWLRSHAQDYDAIVVNGLWNYATFAAAMTLPGGKVPYFVFSHGMMDPWFQRTYPLKHLLKQFFWTFCEGPLLAGARSVLFTTEEERTLARGQFWGWRYREAVVGYGTSEPPPATASQRDAFAAAVPRLNARPYLLYLSRIHPKKGCDLLIEAFAELADQRPELDLVICGPGQESWIQSLQQLAESHGVAERIHWPGMLQGDAKWGAYRGTEAFILPSHQENFGVVVAEAMACGIPVLTTNKVNIWKEVAESAAGFIEDDTIEGTKNLIDRWFSSLPNQKIEMGKNAEKAFLKYFDVNTVSPRLIDTMKRLF